MFYIYQYVAGLTSQANGPAPSLPPPSHGGVNGLSSGPIYISPHVTPPHGAAAGAAGASLVQHHSVPANLSAQQQVRALRCTLRWTLCCQQIFLCCTLQRRDVNENCVFHHLPNH